MARIREIDERKHPEQSERIKRAMQWAGIESSRQLQDLVTWGWSLRTTSSRVEGDTPLTELERPALAAVLSVHPDVLRDGGPELPEMPPAELVSATIVTGEPGHEVATVVVPGERPETMSLDEARRRGLVSEPAEAQGDQAAAGVRLPSAAPPPLRATDAADRPAEDLESDTG